MRKVKTEEIKVNGMDETKLGAIDLIQKADSFVVVTLERNEEGAETSIATGFEGNPEDAHALVDTLEHASLDIKKRVVLDMIKKLGSELGIE